MGTLKYLIDSNTIIDYISGKLPEDKEIWLDSLIDEAVAVSTINKLEVLVGYKFKNIKEIIPFEELINSVTVFPLNEAVENKTIEIRKTIHLKLPDAIIAATALIYNLEIITRNVKDFSRVSGLRIINPYEV